MADTFDQTYSEWYKVKIAMDPNTMLHTDAFHQLIDWVQESTVGEWFYTADPKAKSLVGLAFYFDLESDASMFSLRWLNVGNSVL